MTARFALLLVACFSFFCSSSLIRAADADESTATNVPALNWLDPDFWQTVDGKPLEQNWEIADGEIRLSQPRGGRGSLLSQPLPTTDYELSFEWKIAPGANSGLKYRVRQFDRLWLGLEYQLIDEQAKPPKKANQKTGSIYGLVAPVERPAYAPGDWHSGKIRVVGDSVQHYMDGRLVAAAKTSGPNWDARIARSKFFEREGFGRAFPHDRLMLTDHGGQAAFRAFKFVALPAQPIPVIEPAEPQLGNGFRNSWADQTSIVIWTRTTQRAEMVNGPEFKKTNPSLERQVKSSGDVGQYLSAQLADGKQLNEMLGACPGAPGEVRLTYFSDKNATNSQSTDWVETHADSDFTAQWKLENLKPGTKYAAVIEARPVGGTITAVRRGSFQTAPKVRQPAELTFCLTTCHDFLRRDDGELGHKIYPAMTALTPDFAVHAGDIEYYDKAQPYAWTKELMRFKWARLFSMPRNRQFYSTHSTYFIKDDHDTLKNDCWAGQTYGNVTFEEGVKLFNEEQFPSREQRYQTVRWGKSTQIWLLEGRDYRSPNKQADGPEKSILGAKQKAWLKETLAASDANFKLIFSPTPIVGPDRKNKSDNHANEVFAHEGEELRQFFSEQDNVIVFCGDRHWQYASVDEETGLWEFGCGPGSAVHQLGWKQGDKRPVHRFLRVAGGFLSGHVEYVDGEPRLTLKHRKVTGEEVSSFEFPVSD